MGAYAALWSERETTFKALSERFAPYPGSVPSDSISPTEAHECAVFVRRRFDEPEVEGSGVRVHGAGESPEKLRNAAYPVALLYYLGWWDLAYSRSIAVVGARKPSRAPDASYARSWPTPRTAEGRAERQRQRQRRPQWCASPSGRGLRRCRRWKAKATREPGVDGVVPRPRVDESVRRTKRGSPRRKSGSGPSYKAGGELSTGDTMPRCQRVTETPGSRGTQA